MLLEKFIPSLHLHSIFDINLEQLKSRGIKGVITNLDNTLVESDSPNATEKLVSWLKDVHDHGMRVVIVSNNRQVRVSDFARPLGIPFVYEARKPWGHPFLRALRLLHTTQKDTVVVGDQLLTDVLGGNRFGMYTIWVDPISEKKASPANSTASLKNASTIISAKKAICRGTITYKRHSLSSSIPSLQLRVGYSFKIHTYTICETSISAVQLYVPFLAYLSE